MAPSREDFELQRAQAQEVLRDAQTFYLVALGSSGKMQVVHPASPIHMLGLLEYASQYNAAIMSAMFWMELMNGAKNRNPWEST